MKCQTFHFNISFAAKGAMYQMYHVVIIIIYYINTNEIPGELLHENMISSHVKITCYLHM